jgi:hypothetical protein
LLRQIADLQRLVGDEKARASKLEGKLEMLETQIILKPPRRYGRS